MKRFAVPGEKTHRRWGVRSNTLTFQSIPYIKNRLAEVAAWMRQYNPAQDVISDLSTGWIARNRDEGLFGGNQAARAIV
jgi:hypothetical protein